MIFGKRKKPLPVKLSHMIALKLTPPDHKRFRRAMKKLGLTYESELARKITIDYLDGLDRQKELDKSSSSNQGVCA